MSIHDPQLSGNFAENSSDETETVNLQSLEGLAGLVADMTDINMSRTRENLEQVVRDRLGPNVTLADAERMMERVRSVI